MIHSQDRSRWFGASDTYTIMCSNTDTDSFAKWWSEKLGLMQRRIVTTQMLAGTNWEHRILRHIGVRKMDRQIRMRQLRLRVNLDGETRDRVKEVKTHNAEKPFCVSKAYWMQAQVERYATGKDVDIVAYALLPEDYDNYFRDVDTDRLQVIPVEYDPVWIEHEYFPRLEYFAACLREGCKP